MAESEPTVVTPKEEIAAQTTAVILIPKEETTAVTKKEYAVRSSVHVVIFLLIAVATWFSFSVVRKEFYEKIAAEGKIDARLGNFETVYATTVFLLGVTVGISMSTIFGSRLPARLLQILAALRGLSLLGLNVYIAIFMDKEGLTLPGWLPTVNILAACATIVNNIFYTRYLNAHTPSL